MPEAYSNDLRRKLLEAYEEGQGTLEELAERFSVSEGLGEEDFGVYNRTQKMERPAGAKRGRESRVTRRLKSIFVRW